MAFNLKVGCLTLHVAQKLLTTAFTQARVRQTRGPMATWLCRTISYTTSPSVFPCCRFLAPHLIDIFHRRIPQEPD